MHLESSAETDVGRVRENNEDSYLMRKEIGLYIVADGMGGHLGGKRASSLAVDAVAKFVDEHFEGFERGAQATPLQSSPVPRLLAEAVREACAAIFDASQDDPELHGMGTTVTAMMFLEGRAFVGHVGDSRCYLRRGPRIIQLTDDHSLVNEQIKAGLITREQAAVSGLKNIITRSVGFERDVAVDTFALPVQKEDCFVLCSDGLSNLVDDMEIGEALDATDFDAAAQAMIGLANERGGDDNITVVCIRVRD